MATKSSKPNNYHSMTYNKDTKTIAVTWTRNPEEVQHISNNLHYFKIVPTTKLIKKIEEVTSQRSNKEITDFFKV
jgi:hypothetical protein